MSIIRDFARFIEPSGELSYDNTTSGLSGTTIKSAIDELSVLVGGGNVGSQATFDLYEFTATGGQTIFNLSETFTEGNTITTGNFVTGVVYKITNVGDTDFTLIGAASNTLGEVFTATGPGGGTTGTAEVSITYVPGYIQVYVNGVFVAENDYTASDGQTIVLSESADASDLISLVVLDSFNTATQLRVIDVDASAPDDSLVIDNVGDVSVTSDIKLADNGKAIFGAGSDLQIYHTGGASVIADSGDGSLFIQGESQIVLGNVGNIESYAIFNTDGAVQLRHNNTQKFTTTSSGIDVTGTVTADALTVSSSTPTLQFTDTDNNYDATIQGLSGSLVLTADSGAEFGTESIQFKTGAAERMRIDSAGNVTIGAPVNNDADAQLHVYGLGQTTADLTDSGDMGATLRLSDVNTAAGSGGAIVFANQQGDVANSAGFAAIKGLLSNGNTNTIGHIAFSTRDAIGDTALTERMRIDSAGRVGIGTSSPNYVLNTNYNANATFSNAVSDFTQMWQNSDVNGLGVALADDLTARLVTNNGYELAFNNGVTEVMRISGSNLLVGRTSVGTTGTGHSIRGGDSAIFARAGGEVVIFSRSDSDGEILRFDSNGSAGVGSIGVASDKFYFAGANEGIAIDDSLNAVIPVTDTGAGNNDAVDLGASGGPMFKDLYLSGGVVFGDAGGSGTATSNSIDSYEEGTWTPTYSPQGSAFTSINYDAAVYGKYVKVGAVVHIQGIVRTDAISGGSGNVYIGGMPFTSDNYGVISIGYTNGFTGDNPGGLYTESNSTNIIIRYRTTANSALDNLLDVTDLNTGGNSNYIIFSGTYMTTQ